MVACRGSGLKRLCMMTCRTAPWGSRMQRPRRMPLPHPAPQPTRASSLRRRRWRPPHRPPGPLRLQLPLRAALWTACSPLHSSRCSPLHSPQCSWRSPPRPLPSLQQGQQQRPALLWQPQAGQSQCPRLQRLHWAPPRLDLWRPTPDTRYPCTWLDLSMPMWTLCAVCKRSPMPSESFTTNQLLKAASVKAVRCCRI